MSRLCQLGDAHWKRSSPGRGTRTAQGRQGFSMGIGTEKVCLDACCRMRLCKQGG